MADYTHDIGNNAPATQEITAPSSIDQIAVFIQNADRVYQPVVLDGVSWETQRMGAPGKLTFKVVKDSILDFAEGNMVKLLHNGKNLFLGFVFTKKRNKDNVITVTAYDQIRYLKNKDIYQETNFKASGLVKKIAEDFQLKIGEIEDTGYVIPKYRGSNEALMDIIQTALDHTLVYGKQIFVLYDDFGKLMLKNIDNMHVDILIDAETAEDFNYQSSIDKETYNKVKLYYDNKDSGKREIYCTFDSRTITRWGTLQLCESINPKQCANPAVKSGDLLTLYNRVRRTLSISGALGDDRVRAGTSIYLSLNLGDNMIDTKLMLVESAKHKFTNNQHTMDLTLRGDVIG